MLIGGAIGLSAILFFVLGEETHPEWPELWQLRPLILTPLATALGGACFYIANLVFRSFGLNRIISLIICTIGFLISLWLGIIVGLDGTMWN